MLCAIFSHLIVTDRQMNQFLVIYLGIIYVFILSLFIEFVVVFTIISGHCVGIAQFYWRIIIFIV